MRPSSRLRQSRHPALFPWRGAVSDLRPHAPLIDAWETVLRLLRLPRTPSSPLLFRPAMCRLSQEHTTCLVCSMSLLPVPEDTTNGIPRAFGVWTASAPTSRLLETLSKSKLDGMTACLRSFTKVRQAYFIDIRTLSSFHLPQSDVSGSNWCVPIFSIQFFLALFTLLRALF
jgi:hypothetical protein